MPDATSNLLGETRTRILHQLRCEPQTVNDLAAALSLTDNAIRAQLADLLKENLIAQDGQRPGARKPHTLYALTPKAHELLSHLYVPVLTTLIGLLKEQLSPAELDLLLRGVGHRLAENHRLNFRRLPIAQRIDNALQLIAGLGGDAAAHKESGRWVIRGKGCPLAAIIDKCPDSCHLLETFLGDLLDEPIHEHCTKSPAPQCCFHVGN